MAPSSRVAAPDERELRAASGRPSPARADPRPAAGEPGGRAAAEHGAVAARPRRSAARRSTGISRAARSSPTRSRSGPTEAVTRCRSIVRRAVARCRSGRPGSSAVSAPLALEVTHVLDEVPPHLIADQLVAEARRAAGVAVALYVVDIDGSHLAAPAGSADFPERLDAPPARRSRDRPRGPAAVLRAPRAALPRLRRRAAVAARPRHWRCCCRRRSRRVALEDIAKQGAAALELANDYTDHHRGRPPAQADHAPPPRSSRTCFPPRMSRIAGGELAGGLLPTYEVGGDWFDFVENRDGAWLAIADGAGTGADLRRPRRDGARRAASRAPQRTRTLVEAVRSMHEVVRGLGNREFYVTAIIARWHAADRRRSAGSTAATRTRSSSTSTARFTAAAGADIPRSATADEDLDPTPTETRSTRGERLILITDGVTRAADQETGGSFGADGVPSRSRQRPRARPPPRRPWRSSGGDRLLDRAAPGRRHRRRAGRHLIHTAE